MKYIITQKQLDKIIFEYLDSKNLPIIESEVFSDGKFFKRVYFDVPKRRKGVAKYSLIRYDKGGKWFGWCFISDMLVDDISSLFSLSESNSEEVIGRWVENTLKMKVKNISNVSGIGDSAFKLRIYK